MQGGEGGGQKFLELLKKLFKIVVQVWNFGSLQSTCQKLAIPVLLPLLETLSKILIGNAVKDRQWFSLNLCSVCRTPVFQILIHLWEQKSRKERDQASRRWDTTTILFLPKREASCWRCRGSARIAGSPCSIFIEDCRQCFQQWEWHWDHCI